ncbi:MAG: hypothetical protein B6244_04290 [Candidatus Cloacimonetes bacterium 4572_55]|nr:MAG: hypothetical protein B6244_04290 [Candidatus Cloacimonetes bacterium 4572_55]
MSNRQKILMIALLISVAICMSAPAYSGDVKLGYIDSQQVLQSCREYQDAAQVYEQKMGEWKLEAQDREKDAVELANQIEKQSMMWTEDRKQEMERKLKRLEEDYRRFVDEIFGEQGKGAQMQIELAQPVFDKINTILIEIAKDGNYTMIFDSIAGNVLYADDSLDLTDRIIEELNKDYEESGGSTDDQPNAPDSGAPDSEREEPSPDKKDDKKDKE